MTKLEAANAALKTFSEVWIEERKGFHVCWINFKGEKVSRKWQARSGSHYPPWDNKFPYGGTTLQALHQLIVWLRSGYVFPLGVWMYWASDKIRLGTDTTVQILKDNGWPEQAICMKCKEPIEGQFDWFSINGREGCGHFRECN